MNRDELDKLLSKYDKHLDDIVLDSIDISGLEIDVSTFYVNLIIGNPIANDIEKKIELAMNNIVEFYDRQFMLVKPTGFMGDPIHMIKVDGRPTILCHDEDAVQVRFVSYAACNSDGWPFSLAPEFRI